MKYPDTIPKFTSKQYKGNIAQPYTTIKKSNPPSTQKSSYCPSTSKEGACPGAGQRTRQKDEPAVKSYGISVDPKR